MSKGYDVFVSRMAEEGLANAPKALWDFGKTSVMKVPRNRHFQELYQKLMAVRSDISGLDLCLGGQISNPTSEQTARWLVAANWLEAIVKGALEERTDTTDDEWLKQIDLADRIESIIDTCLSLGWAEDTEFLNSLCTGNNYFKFIKGLPSDPTRRTGRTPLGSALRDAAWLMTNGFCWYCGVQTLPSTFCVDHIHPVADGGTNDPTNLVPCCKPCNSAKHAMPLETFRMRRGGGLFWFELRPEGI